MDDFLKSKNDILSKIDKSSKGSIDKKIIPLCETINSKENLFTLSSCSGRICLLESIQGNKKESNWLITTHEIADSKQFIEEFNNYNRENIIFFKQESAILHIQTKSIEDANKIIIIAKQSGFNRCGIITSGRKNVVELIHSLPISTPIFDKIKLVDDNYIEYLIKISNQNLEKTWKKIEMLRISIEKEF